MERELTESENLAALLDAALAVLEARRDGTFGRDGVRGFEMLEAAVNDVLGHAWDETDE